MEVKLSGYLTGSGRILQWSSSIPPKQEFSPSWASPVEQISAAANRILLS